MDRKELRALSTMRLQESKALLRLGFCSGAYYLGGYAIECALKACIARQTRRHEFPDRKRVEASHTHNLRELVRLAELERAHLNEALRDPIFRFNWNLAQGWSEQSRYRVTSEEMRAHSSRQLRMENTELCHG